MSEPHRVYRRQFVLSHATLADSRVEATEKFYSI